MVDLKKCRPMGTPMSPDYKVPSDRASDSFGHNTSLRKSFSKAERPLSLKRRTTDVKTIEENTSGTDSDEEVNLTADIVNLPEYNQIFGGRGCKYVFFLNLCDKIYFGIISQCYLAEVTINLLRIAMNIMYHLMVRTCIYLSNIFDHKKSKILQ